MSEEFKKARGEAAYLPENDCGNYYGDSDFCKGADWAYEWCLKKEIGPAAFRQIEKQREDLEKLKAFYLAVSDEYVEDNERHLERFLKGDEDAFSYFIKAPQSREGQGVK